MVEYIDVEIEAYVYGLCWARRIDSDLAILFLYLNYFSDGYSGSPKKKRLFVGIKSAHEKLIAAAKANGITEFIIFLNTFLTSFLS